MNPWLAVERRTPDAVIYRVLDRPRAITAATARPATGFGFEEPDGTTTARWLEEPVGTLTLTVTGRRRPLALELELASFAQPRRVAFRLDGRPVGSASIPPDAFENVVVPLGDVAPGTHTIELIPTPGPQSIAETTGQPDPRSVSVTAPRRARAHARTRLTREAALRAAALRRRDGGRRRAARARARDPRRARRLDAEVATTCATNHFTWANELPAGESVEDGVLVRRFEVGVREDLRYHQLHARVLGGAASYAEELEWLGHSVWSPDLQRFLEDSTSDYDLAIFSPYLFGTTLWGAQVDPGRSALVPCLHDEPYARLSTVRRVVEASRGCLFNAPAEERLAQAAVRPARGRRRRDGLRRARRAARRRASPSRAGSAPTCSTPAGSRRASASTSPSTTPSATPPSGATRRGWS